MKFASQSNNFQALLLVRGGGGELLTAVVDTTYTFISGLRERSKEKLYSLHGAIVRVFPTKRACALAYKAWI